MCRVLVFVLLYTSILSAEVSLQNVRIFPKLSYYKKGWVTMHGEIVARRFKEEKVAVVAEISNRRGKQIYSQDLIMVADGTKKFIFRFFLSVRNNHTIKIYLKTKTRTYPNSIFRANVYNYRNQWALLFLTHSKDQNHLLDNLPSLRSNKRQYGYYGRSPKIKVLSHSISSLSQNHLEYHQFKIIVLHIDQKISDLDKDPRKAEALKKWISLGGKLVLQCSDPLRLKNSKFFSALLQLDKVKNWSTPPSSKWSKYLSDTSQIFPLAHPNRFDIFGEGALWYQPKGMGAIIYFGIDGSSYPKKLLEIWNEQILPSLLMNSKSLPSANYSSVQKYLNTIKQNFGVRSISLVLFLYVLLIGPINFFIWKKRGLTGRLLWSIPVVSVGFAFVILLYGIASHGLQSYNLSLSLYQALPDDDYFYCQTYTGVFSASHNLYSFDSKHASHTPLVSSHWRDHHTTFIYQQKKQKLQLQNYPLNLWEMGYLKTTELIPKNFKIKHLGDKVYVSKPIDMEIKAPFYLSHSSWRQRKYHFYVAALPDIPIGVENSSYQLHWESMDSEKLLQLLKQKWNVGKYTQLSVDLLYNSFLKGGNTLVGVTNLKSTRLKTTPLIASKGELSILKTFVNNPFYRLDMAYKWEKPEMILKEDLASLKSIAKNNKDYRLLAVIYAWKNQLQVANQYVRRGGYQTALRVKMLRNKYSPKEVEHALYDNFSTLNQIIRRAYLKNTKNKVSLRQLKLLEYSSYHATKATVYAWLGHTKKAQNMLGMLGANASKKVKLLLLKKFTPKEIENAVNNDFYPLHQKVKISLRTPNAILIKDLQLLEESENSKFLNTVAIAYALLGKAKKAREIAKKTLSKKTTIQIEKILKQKKPK